MKFAAAFIALALVATGPAGAEPYKEIPSEDRDAQPVRPPRPFYPMLAQYFGVSGRCEVRFDVDQRGYPRQIRPYCTHTVFCKSARDAVGQVMFKPKILGGRAVTRQNVVYPLEYNITRDTDAAPRATDLDAREVYACVSEPIS